MNIALPKIIQGGMGAGVSNWKLANAVSALGQLGIVAGTALDQIMARRLQEGDAGGHIRRALEQFPFPTIARRILETFYVPGGKPKDQPYHFLEMPAIDWKRCAQEICMAANFVEVFLAREGHSNPVGINYLEKIQLTLLPSIYGAMLAGVAVVVMGAGIPLEIPAVLDRLAASHAEVSYPIRVSGAQASDRFVSTFNPADFLEPGMEFPPLRRPDFLPIISSDALAGIILKRATGEVSGFIVEGNTAGGHNAPPRGRAPLSENGQPVYGPRDEADLAALRKLGLPFWLAGSYGTPERLRDALAAGAAGIQAGTLFALCEDSGLVPDVRRALVRKALAGDVRIFTDPLASPTGFPFKVADLHGTLAHADTYESRRRYCDLGFLREPYLKDGKIVGYRCAAEPTASYVAKGGKLEDTIGRKCLCNALVSNIGYPQLRPNGTQEACLITLGDDLSGLNRLCTIEKPDYSAADAIRFLLGTT